MVFSTLYKSIFCSICFSYFFKFGLFASIYICGNIWLFTNGISLNVNFFFNPVVLRTKRIFVQNLKKKKKNEFKIRNIP